MPNPAVEELYTVVQNTSDAERVYGYLGPRGMRLAPGEAVAIPGDLVATLGAQAAEGQRRKFDALQRSLEAGRLQLNSRPTPVLWDAMDDRPKSLAVIGGVLGTVDPTYNEGDSESFAPV